MLNNQLHAFDGEHLNHRSYCYVRGMRIFALYAPLLAIYFYLTLAHRRIDLFNDYRLFPDHAFAIGVGFGAIDATRERVEESKNPPIKSKDKALYRQTLHHKGEKERRQCCGSEPHRNQLKAYDLDDQKKTSNPIQIIILFQGILPSVILNVAYLPSAVKPTNARLLA